MYLTMRTGNSPKTITLDAPHALEATIWLDPGDSSFVDLATTSSLITALHPKIGAGMILSQSADVKRPTYNLTGSSFASGRSSITISGSQHLFGAGNLPLLSSFDGSNAYTIAINTTYTHIGVNHNVLTFTHNTSVFHNISLFAQAGNDRHNNRYRSPTYYASVSPAKTIIVGEQIWNIMDFDGVNTLTNQTKGGGRGSTTAGVADVASEAEFNQLFFGAFFGLAASYAEIGDFVAFNRKLDDTERATLIEWLETRL